MARLIDADEIRKKAVPHTIGEHGWVANIRKWAVLVGDIDAAPTVDAAEVVRCRDCKYYYDYGVNRDHCCHRSKNGKQVFDVKFKADDFCSYGERKEDG